MLEHLKKQKKILNINGINSKLIKSKRFKEFYKSYFYKKKLLNHILQVKLQFLTIIRQ